LAAASQAPQITQIFNLKKLYGGDKINPSRELKSVSNP
jgi:hypothetical protein